LTIGIQVVTDWRLEGDQVVALVVPVAGRALLASDAQGVGAGDQAVEVVVSLASDDVGRVVPLRPDLLDIAVVIVVVGRVLLVRFTPGLVSVDKAILFIVLVLGHRSGRQALLGQVAGFVVIELGATLGVGAGEFNDGLLAAQAVVLRACRLAGG
jgi:hypothetical protein